MPEEGFLPVVNQAQENPFEQVFPSSPTLSSHPASWNSFHLHCLQLPSWETPIFSLAHHTIVIFPDQPPSTIERSFDGLRKQEQVRVGDIVVIPAHVPTGACWHGKAECIFLGFEPKDFANLIHEAVHPDRVELCPKFATADPLVYQVGLALKIELAANPSSSRFYAESAKAFLAAHLVQHYCTRKPRLEITRGLPQRKLNQALEYIHAHLSEDVSLEAIATHLDMSSYYFCRLFKQSTGTTPYQYLIQQRVEYAKQLLAQQKLSVTEVAFAAGFASHGHLNRYFKRLVGVTPREFVRRSQ
jgi:AraC family transcriptional regulator